MSYKRLTLSSVVGIFCVLGLQCIDHAHAGKTQDAEIEDMISSLTLQQQINQMAQIDVNLLFQGDLDGQIAYFIGEQAYGSILVDNVYVDAPYFNEVMSKVQKVAKANNLPPVLPAIDAVHGANTIKNAILFPQQINLGCTFNPEYAKYSGKITARDTLASGFSWLYSPIIGLGIQSLWGRVFETFGEDPHLVGKMGTKLVEGIQENGKSAACVKHFVGYSDPRDGHDRAPSWIPTRHLYQYFVRPWRDVIDNAKPLSVMESYTEYDGVPNVANQFSLQTLLREDLGFEGVLVSDYHEVENLFGFHHVAVDNNEAVMMALVEGSLDVSMIPWDFWSWSDGVMAAINEVNGTKSQGVIKERIKQSLRRILKMKHDLGMFDEDTYVESAKDLDLIGDPEVRKEALKIARESIVLAKNNYMTLPVAIRDGIGREIDKKIKVHVTGPSSDSLPYQCGGWTIHWQGANNNGEFSYGRTVLDAAKDNDKWEVTSSCGVDINGASCEDENLDSLVAERKEADYIIVCIGEENHAGMLFFRLILISNENG
jgi:beta-glucosidase